jgi:uncharacterized membrane protein
MATLTVWKVADPDGADQALATLEGLQKQELIEVLGGAVVSWPPDKKKPKTRQLRPERECSTAHSGGSCLV